MSKRNIIIPSAQEAMNQLKHEIANETGLLIKNNDYSNMTSYQYGYMVKKMIEEQEKQMVENTKINIKN